MHVVGRSDSGRHRLSIRPKAPPVCSPVAFIITSVPKNHTAWFSARPAHTAECPYPLRPLLCGSCLSENPRVAESEVPLLYGLFGDLSRRTSMRRHYLSRPTWRPPVERWSSVSFAMLPSALLVSLLFGDSVHYEILLFGLLRRRCNLRSGLSCLRRVDQVRMAQSPYLDPK